MRKIVYNKKFFMVFVVIFACFFLLSCGEKSDVSKLEERVDELSKKVDQLTKRSMSCWQRKSSWEKY